MKTFSKRSFVLLALSLALTSLTLTAIPLASANDDYIELTGDLLPLRWKPDGLACDVKSKAVWKFSSDDAFTVDEIDDIVFYYTPTGGGDDQAVSVIRYFTTKENDVVIVLNVNQLPETADFTYVLVTVDTATYRSRGPGFAWGWRW